MMQITKQTTPPSFVKACPSAFSVGIIFNPGAFSGMGFIGKTLLISAWLAKQLPPITFCLTDNITASLPGYLARWALN